MDGWLHDGWGGWMDRCMVGCVMDGVDEWMDG